MGDVLKEMHLYDPQAVHYQIDEKYLEEVFPDFFSVLYQAVSQSTVTVNEYAYLCTFLYPEYMKQVYEEAANIQSCQTEEAKQAVRDRVKEMVN